MSEARGQRLPGTWSADRLWQSAAVAGLVAGALFGAAQSCVALASGAPGLLPWRYAASLLGPDALRSGQPALVFLLGALVHFALSASYGALWGVLAGGLPPRARRSVPAQTAGAMAFSLGLYLLDFPVLAGVFAEWFLQVPQVPQAVLHVTAFGLPLGVLTALLHRRGVRLARREQALAR